jgi:hypothetical protein
MTTTTRTTTRQQNDKSKQARKTIRKTRKLHEQQEQQQTRNLTTYNTYNITIDKITTNDDVNNICKRNSPPPIKPFFHRPIIPCKARATQPHRTGNLATQLIN